MARPVSPKVAKLMQQGMQLMQASAFLEAGRAFERAAQQMPDLADAHALRADALMRAGKLDAALAAADRALRLAPGWGEALMLRGNVLALAERFADAEASFREAMRLLGPTPALQANLGNVLLEQKRFEEALAAFDLALAAGQGVELLMRRARALDGLQRYEACEQAWRRVLELDPGNLEALERLANLGLVSGRYELMEQACREGMARAPNAASFHLGLAACLTWLGKDEDQAVHSFARAAELSRDADPDVYEEAVVGKANALFRSRRMREGWEAYFHHYPRRTLLEERFPRLVQDIAEMRALRGATVCIHPVQGIGDEIFFLRFASAFRALGNRLLLKTHPKLVPLLALRRDLFDWVGLEADPCPDYDVDLLTSDLSLAGSETEAAPLAFAVDSGRQKKMRAKLSAFGPPPYVGVTWRGGLTPDEHKAWGGRAWLKVAPPRELGATLRDSSATVVVVQRVPLPDELGAFHEGLGRRALDASAMNDDLEDAVALLSVLTDYVGVSNTNMHLIAGIENAFARVLVTTPGEWRWGLAGEHSPWFPGFRLYRQRPGGAWGEALQDLAADLRGSPGA